MWAFIQLTFREAFSRKVFHAFFIVSTLAGLTLLFLLSLNIVRDLGTLSFISGGRPQDPDSLRKLVRGIQGGVAVALFTVGLFMSLFATGNLIPEMLRAGKIDLLISKPLSRNRLLLGRILGAVAVVAFNVFYLVIFFWLILSVRTGFWNWGFLLAGLMVVLTYIALYSLMVLLSILFKSGAVSLMGTFLIIFLAPVLMQRNRLYLLLSADSRITRNLIDAFYYFFPKPGDLAVITQKLARGAPVESWTPLWSSLLFSVVIILLSSLIFRRKSF